jgi:lysyl-tRNA synthetase class 2
MDQIRQERLNRLERIRARGIDPYPSGPFDKDPIVEVIDRPLETPSRIAGRIMLYRQMGNLTFAQLQDETGRMQIMISRKAFGDDYKFWVEHLDLGDIIGVEGVRYDTNKGERSLLVERLTLLSKALRPLPDKWKGLRDEEKRLRQRYLDILLNPDVRDMIYKKDRFWNSVRGFLKERGFVEVQTPVLEVTPGGGDARPFLTHHNALDLDVKLRISMGELWQKRLMVAGLEKTFEIGRQFRNEGMDAEHLQDYEQMEFYWAYANFERGMTLVRELFIAVAKATFETTKFQIGDFEVELDAEWPHLDYAQVIREKTGIDIFEASLEEMIARLRELNVAFSEKGFNRNRAVDNLWKYCRRSIAGPAFLVNEPVEISPLAKRSRQDGRLVERFHVLLAGSELGNGYSELNDPIDQAERFGVQQKLRDQGDDEAQAKDDEFVEALEYGMPPTVGFGMSERVFAFLMNKSMRECQIFPLVRPLAD